MNKFNENYDSVIKIDNDIYKLKSGENIEDIEEIRFNLISDNISILENDILLSYTKSGMSFMDCIIFPGIKN